MSKYYVYAYVDQRTGHDRVYGQHQFPGEPFYIGKGTGVRQIKHRYEKRGDEKNRIIATIKRETGSWPTVLKVGSGLSEDGAFVLEESLIKLIGRADVGNGPLTNRTDGGFGGCGGRIVSTATREKLRVMFLGKAPRQPGWHHSEETKAMMRKPKSTEAVANMRKARQGRPPMSALVRGKISATLKGRPLLEQTRTKMLGRTPWNKGVPCTEEMRRHLSIVKAGTPPPNKGKKMSPEMRERYAWGKPATIGYIP